MAENTKFEYEAKSYFRPKFLSLSSGALLGIDDRVEGRIQLEYQFEASLVWLTYKTDSPSVEVDTRCQEMLQESLNFLEEAYCFADPIVAELEKEYYSLLDQFVCIEDRCFSCWSISIDVDTGVFEYYFGWNGEFNHAWFNQRLLKKDDYWEENPMPVTSYDVINPYGTHHSTFCQVEVSRSHNGEWSVKSATKED